MTQPLYPYGAPITGETHPEPLPTPRASLGKILRTCWRKVAAPIELLNVDALLEDAETRSWTEDRAALRAEANGDPEAADWHAEHAHALGAEVARLRVRQAELEKEVRG